MRLGARGKRGGKSVEVVVVENKERDAARSRPARGEHHR